jgi:hypothetical protein
MKGGVMALVRDGASLDARYAEPSIDLATLLASLAEAVPADPSARQPAARWPLLAWDAGERVLTVNTRAALTRFWATGGWRRLLDEREGFVRDAPVPRSGARAHVGGRLVPGTEAPLRQGVDALVRALDAAIDELAAGGWEPAAHLAGARPADLLGPLGARLGCPLPPLLSGQTRVERVAFARVGATQQARRAHVARVMAAVEDLQGDRAVHVHLFGQAVQALLEERDYTPREIQAAVRHHLQQSEEQGTQLGRFFDFLQDEALARVRTQVGHRMMEALAAEATARDRGRGGDPGLFAAYCAGAVATLEALAATDVTDVELNLSPLYGDAGIVSLHEQVIRSGLERCLPVWPEWRTQLFERAAPEDDGVHVRRELSYRFRVNGRSPETGQPAYLSRLDRIKDLLLGEEPRWVTSALAELVLLASVVPGRTEPPSPSTGDAARANAARICRRLEEGGRAAIAALLSELRARSQTMDRVATALVELLRDAGTPVTGRLAGRTWTYYLNLLRDLVDPQRIASPLPSPLAVGATKREEQAGFFASLRVTPERPMEGAFLSVRVRVQLSERSLRQTGETATLTVQRVLPDRVVPVLWRPHRLDRETGRPVPALDGDRAWLLPGRVELQVDTGVGLGNPRERKPANLLGMAASRSAFAVLAFVVLERLFARLPAERRPTLSMLRLQGEGREAASESGEEGLFAAAQAVELVLGRDLDLRMQGLSLGEGGRDGAGRFKRAGAFGALLAGFPVHVSHQAEARPAVGVLTFAARPSNVHPDQPDQEGQRLFLVRTYVATPVEVPAGYLLRSLGSRTELDAAEAPLPFAVHEEIRRLYEAHDCRHVLVLAHRFGERRVGQRPSRVRLQGQEQLLRAVAADFPDLVLYPLVRDTFPATRLRRRQHEEAFEILDPDDHEEALPEEVRALWRDYTPVYSLATLHVVGDGPGTRKPQSGFCTYFLQGDDRGVPVEVTARLRANLLPRGSPVRSSLQAALRGIHYLEAERSVTKARLVQPVLDPYDWMTPGSAGKVGEVVVFESSRRGHGSVALSLTAALEQVSRVLHARAEEPHRGPRHDHVAH